MILWGNRFVLGRFKRVKIFLLIFSLTVLLLANAGSKAPVLANDDFQRRSGEIVDVRTEDGITILVRDAPPTVSGLGYRLANEICSVDDGTQFVATERRNVVNGEVWYRVEITNVVSQVSTCPEPPFIGWIIGQFANGDEVVALEEVALTAQPIPIPQTTPEPIPTANPSPDPASTPTLVPDPTTAPEPTPTVRPDPTPTPVPTPSPQATIPPTTISDAPTPTEEAQNIGGGLQWFSLLGHYTLLSFGAIFGFIVVSIERADNNSEFDVFPEGESFWEGLKKIRKIYWIRLGIAVLIVNLFRFSALNLVGVTGLENELVMASFRFITQGLLGSFVGGFVLAIVLLKFVAFTEG